MKKIFAANWKLNKTPAQAREFLSLFKAEASKTTDFYKTREVLIFPQAFSLDAVSQVSAGTEIGFGPQNVYTKDSGAFTGENSTTMAKELKAQFALVGHSERREIFKEQDQLLNQKNLQVEKTGMTSVFCIGETLQQRQAFQTLPVCFSQLDLGLEGVRRDARLILAYEPVWAIGTGQVATLEQVAEVHSALFDKLNVRGFKNFQVLYGGSVKPDNASDLLKVPHVDGFLIGGAALEVSSFLKICLS
jgi:triosephosphate isomerase